MQKEKCLLRNFSESYCTPTNPLFIGLHGFTGKGGRVANAEIPRGYQGVLLADSPVRESQEPVYQKLERYVKTFSRQFGDVRAELINQGKSENEIRIKSLYLWSRPPGTGKTTTACALLNEYLLQHFVGSLKRNETPKQRPVYFLDVNLLQTKYNEFNRSGIPKEVAESAARDYYNMIKRAKYTDFVVMDDIGVRNPTDGFRGDLHSVIDYRTANHLPVVYTSNIPIKELPTVFGESRLYDRIRDMTQEIEFVGTSKRGKR
jgi:DNA replication protein DnaC